MLAAQDNSNKLIAEAERHRDEAKTALDVLGDEIDGAKHDAELDRGAGRRASRARIRGQRCRGERGRRARAAQRAGELDRARWRPRDRLRVEMLDQALARRASMPSAASTPPQRALVDRFVAGLEQELMVNETLARRYATAIFSAAGDTNAVDRVGADLSAIAARVRRRSR